MDRSVRTIRAALLRTGLSAALLGACVSGCRTVEGGGNAVGPMAAAQKCEALKGQIVGANEGTVTGAAIRPAVPAAGPRTQAVPEYCGVTVAANDSPLKVAVYLPTAAWNNKMVQAGGGGFKGTIAAPSVSTAAGGASASIVAENYAIVASNGGHDAADNANALFASDAVKLAEYAYLAEHRAANFGKSVIQKFYGTLPSRAYFEGCSTGGHDAMMESQRYPQDFDGIVARAPAGNFIGLYLQFNRISTALRAPGALLNPNKQTLLANAVLASCDAQDGVADGIISNPAACRYDPAALRCTGGADKGDACLSDAQINAVKVVTSGFTTPDGVWSHPGYSFGGENAPDRWGQYIWPGKSGSSAQQNFSDQWVRGFITGQVSYDPTKFNAGQWLPALRMLGEAWQAFNPDLSAFQARGGKLIMWAGANDTSVAPKDTARYYDMAVQRMGQANADKTLEAFFAPGVGHCGGGAGPDIVDLIKPLSIWVEKGTPPSQQALTLRKIASDGAIAMTRPLCKYPAYPRFSGTGDPNQASSFTCSSP